MFSNRSASFLKLSKVRHLPSSRRLSGSNKKEKCLPTDTHLPLAPSPQVKQALADADVCVKLRPDWELWNQAERKELKELASEGHVLKLHASLYGLRSSGKNWYHTLRTYLRSTGLRPTRAGPFSSLTLIVV